MYQEVLVNDSHRQPTMEELEKAFLVNAADTLGPDGITMRFLKFIWETISEHILTIVTGLPQPRALSAQDEESQCVVTLSKPRTGPPIPSEGGARSYYYQYWRRGLERLMQRRNGNGHPRRQPDPARRHSGSHPVPLGYGLGLGTDR